MDKHSEAMFNRDSILLVFNQLFKLIKAILATRRSGNEPQPQAIKPRAQ